METKYKILVVGDVRGRFNQFFQRVESINKKAGPFEILLCVGDFFSEENQQNEELNAYKIGHKQIIIPTYILGPNNKHLVKYYENLDNGEICKNLTYLGKRGLYILTNGIKIAYLSGLEKPSGCRDEEFYFQRDDVESLRNSCLVKRSALNDYRGIDILLTSQWPFETSNKNKNASKLISYLCRHIKPRYHFCGMNNTYFEPPPYRMPSDEITQLELSTRLISLAEVGNTKKEKYIYALGLIPVDKMRVMELIQKTTNEVICPYMDLISNSVTSKESNLENTQYFFDMGSKNCANNQKRAANCNDMKIKRSKVPHWDQDICWFCLSTPDIEKHLIISVGEHFYLALAKGPINDWHILILSIEHIQCAAMLTDEDWKELIKFKRALKNFFDDLNQVVCFTERNYKCSHLQINVFSIDKGYAWKIQHGFEDKAEEYNLKFETIPQLTSGQVLPNQGPYFVAELPNDITLITRQMNHFPIHFARDVFCSENLLNCDEKVDWKQCKLDKNIEIKLVTSFKEKFSKYDFTL